MKNLTMLFLVLAVSCNKVGFDSNPTPLNSNNTSPTVETPAVADPRCSTAAAGLNFHAGTGSAVDPYLVCSVPQWNAINAYCAANTDCQGTNFLVGQALTFSSLNTATDDLSSFTSSDNNATPIVFFSGNMDGGKHLMSGIIMVGDGSNSTGLIGLYKGVSGTISNFKVSQSFFDGADFENLGSVLGAVDNLVTENMVMENITVSKTVLKGKSSVGAVLGQGNVLTGFSMKNIKVDAKITTTEGHAGAVVGVTSNMTMENTDVKGEINSYDCAGGTVGMFMNNSSIKKAKSDVKVTVNGCGGGLVGQNVGTLIIDEATVVANVTADNSNIGGVIGQNSGSSLTMTKTTVKGTITSVYGSGVAGAVGTNTTNLTIDGVTVDMNASGVNNIAGLVGANHGSLTGSNTSIKGSFIGSGNTVGGIIGMNTSTSTLNHVTATTTLQGAAQVGGLVAVNYSGLSGSQVKATSNITINGQYEFGGLAGINTSNLTFTQLEIKTSMSQDASVTQLENIAGVIGRNHGLVNLTTGVITADIELLGSTDVRNLGMFIGNNTAQTNLIKFKLNARAATSGSVTCDGVTALFGVDNSGSSSQAQSSINTNFDDFSCI